MKARDFCYWLQGYFELYEVQGGETSLVITSKQAQCIKNHLNMVFKHEIDPSNGDQKHNEELNKIHVTAGTVLSKFTGTDAAFPDAKFNC